MSTGDTRELFKSRNEHGERIVKLEECTKQIARGQEEIKQTISDNHKELREDILEYRKEGLDDIKVVQKTIGKFIEDINGIPRNNAKEIDQIKTERCKPMAQKVDGLRKISWMILGMGVILSALIGGGILGLVFGWFKTGG